MSALPVTDVPQIDELDIAAPGAFLYWPENVFWSFQVLRLFAQANAGAADFTEVHLAVKDLTAGDVEGWYAAFHGLAVDVEANGEAALAAGDTVTAREDLKRASNYHRSSGFFLRPDEPRYLEAVDARRRTFQRAAPLDDLLIEPIDVPFDGVALPGYVITAREGEPKGTVLIFGGADSVCEELYFALGRGLAERGFRAVTVDGPGQGEALRRGLISRHDWEVPTAAVIDFLLARPDVDPEHLGFVGQSLGGLYAVRVAAHEPRLRSVVAWGGQWDVHALWAGRVRQGGPFVDHLSRWLPTMLGAEDLEGATEKLRPFTAAQDAPLVNRPLLVLHGEADTTIPVAFARRLHDAIPREDKELRIYHYGEPGCEHCQVDSITVANRDIGEWFNRTL